MKARLWRVRCSANGENGTRANWVCTTSRSGTVPAAKLAMSVAPPKNEPARSATPSTRYNGPHGRSGVKKPSTTAMAPGRIDASRNRNNSAETAFGCGIRFSSPNANARKSNANAHGKSRAGVVEKRAAARSPISPSRPPANV